MTRIRFGHWNAAREERLLSTHHDDGLELVYVRHGRVSWDCEGEILSVQAGELSFTWPWQSHAAVGQRLPPVDIFWVLLPLTSSQRPRSGGREGLELDLEIPSSEASSLLQELSCCPGQTLKPPDSFQQKMLSLVAQLEQSGGELDLPSLGWLYLLLHDLQEAIRIHSTPQGGDPQRQRLQAFLNEELPFQLEECWSLDRMAKACSLGRTRFAELVKEQRGDSPIRVLSRLRIDAAKHHLIESKLSVTEIALACGFSSSQRFATVFKSYCGQSPRDFRHQAQSSPDFASE